MKAGRSIISTDLWRNIPKCVSDYCGDLADRLTFVENKILDIKEENRKNELVLSGLKSGQEDFLKETKQMVDKQF